MCSPVAVHLWHSTLGKIESLRDRARASPGSDPRFLRRESLSVLRDSLRSSRWLSGLRRSRVVPPRSRYRGSSLRSKPRFLRAQTVTISREHCHFASLVTSSRSAVASSPMATDAAGLEPLRDSATLRRESLSVSREHCETRSARLTSSRSTWTALSQGDKRCRSRGNSTASRMFSSPSIVMMRRSPPRPQPACGGIPYLNILV